MNIIKQALEVLLLTIIVSFLTFTVLYLLPGTSEQIRFGMELNVEVETDYFRAGRLFSEYTKWARDVLKGDWGVSAYSSQQVSTIILERLPVTVVIALLSAILTLICAVFWCWGQELLKNSISVRHPRFARWCYHASIQGEHFLLSFIPLSLGVLVLVLIGVVRGTLFNLPLWVRLLFPVLVMVLLQFPRYTRSLQVSIDQIYELGFVDFAYSLGFGNKWVWWREILPNAIPFSISLSVVQFSYLVGGTIILEKIFLIPGLGSTLFDAVLTRDRSLVLMGIVVISMLVGVVHAVHSVLLEHKK